jgi:hypothetical protein
MLKPLAYSVWTPGLKLAGIGTVGDKAYLNGA